MMIHYHLSQFFAATFASGEGICILLKYEIRIVSQIMKDTESQLRLKVVLEGKQFLFKV